MQKTYISSFPKGSLSWFILGIIFLLIPFVFIGFGVDFASFKYGSALFLGSPVFGLAGIWVGRDVIRFFLGKRRNITVEDDGFHIDGEYYTFQEISGILDQYGYDNAQIFITGRKTLDIRTLMYDEFYEFYDLLVEKTFDRLLATTIEKIDGKQDVEFGKNVSLSEKGVKIKKKLIAFSDIRRARTFIGNNNGADYEELIIETGNGEKIDIETHTIINLPILMEVIHTKSPNIQVGV